MAVVSDSASVLQPPTPDSALASKPKFECKICGKCFPSSTRYHKHVNLHSALRLFKCTFPGCGKTYKRKPHLQRHLATHQETNAYCCSYPDCNKTFPSNQKLAKHVRSHEKFHCKECGKSFRKKAKFEEHQKAHEAAGSDSLLRCPQCNKAVGKSSLQRHMKRHKIHACGQCEETFPRFQDLVKHVRVAHPKNHLCPDCGKAYKREAALRDHQRRVHADELVICPRADCRQTFTSASSLYQHERVVHLGLRPFSCKDCGQTFAYRHVLRRHRRIIHIGKSNSSGSPERPSRRQPHSADVGANPASVGTRTQRISLVAAFSQGCSCRSGPCQQHGSASASSDAAIALPNAPEASAPAIPFPAPVAAPEPLERPVPDSTMQPRSSVAVTRRCATESEVRRRVRLRRLREILPDEAGFSPVSSH